jgi:hypothetical protein
MSRSSLILIALCLCAPGPAARAQYQLGIAVQIGDTISGRTLTNLGFSASERILDVNNAGTVTFVAAYSGGNGIFTQNVLVVGSGTNIGGRSLTSFSSPAINNLGEVAFVGAYSGGTGVFTHNAKLAEAGQILSGRTFTAFGNSPNNPGLTRLDINDSGAVAFRGHYSGGSGIFTQNGAVVDIGDTVDGFTFTGFSGDPRINNAGTVTFHGSYLGSSGIFTQSEEIVSRGDTFHGRTFQNLGVPDISDDGTLSFFGASTSGLGFIGLFSQMGEEVMSGDIIDGQEVVNFGPLVDVADGGLLAFRGSRPNFAGIFTQNNFVAGYGTVIDGKTLSLLYGNPAMSDDGQHLAFFARFSDGTHAVVLASAVSATVLGTITLEGCLDSEQSINFEFRPTDNSGNIQKTVTLAANGSFSIPDLPRKSYTVWIKGSKWLAKTVSVNVSSGDVSNVSATLLAADATNDNSVDVNDLAAFIAAFDADPSAPNWNGGIADFNCDDLVAVDDLALLIQNFDKSGDN